MQLNLQTLQCLKWKPTKDVFFSFEYLLSLDNQTKAFLIRLLDGIIDAESTVASLFWSPKL